MKILYLSCHAILEYDELKLFHELGIDFFSLGSYVDPQHPVDPMRPAIDKPVDQDLYRQAPDRMKLPKEFVDKFDAVVIMHGEVSEGNWVIANWENMKHKPVVLRTIGQFTGAHEAKLAPYKAQGLKIVRYSPTEERLPNFAGSDALIRFYKDPEEFGNYNGQSQEVITFAQNMKTRAEFCNYAVFEKVTNKLNAHVYGPNNESSGPLNGGLLTYDEMKQKYRDSRLYFYTGTQPAAYTLNFIEAWMSGIPIVAIGPMLANSLQVSGNSYEVADLIPGAGYVSDDVSELRSYIEMLYNNPHLCQEVGQIGRKRAIEHFGKETIKSQWMKFLSSL